MNKARKSIQESTYAASTALNKGGISGLLNQGLVGEFIRSVVGENLSTLRDDFLSASLLSDIQEKSAQANQWDVLRIYIQMANAMDKEEYAWASLRREVFEHLANAARSITPSEAPALDLKTATSTYEKHAKCDASKSAAVTALQIIAQPIIDNPSSNKNLVETATELLERIRSESEAALTKDSKPPVVIIKRKARIFCAPTLNGS